jgi:hypothetical protein
VSLDNPKVSGNPILLREINEVLNSFPSMLTETIDDKMVEEYSKVEEDVLSLFIR